MCLIDERVLVLAPTGQDSQLICEQLQTVGLSCIVCRDLEDLATAVMEGAATGVIAEEALHESGVQRLIEALGAQPAWSDLPVTILTSSDVNASAQNAILLRRLADAGNITLLERPSRIMTLLMTLQAAVRARKRQYEFREYLHQYERYQEQVRQTQKLESLGVLAGGIAHDFNNLLTGILGNASLASELLPPSHEAHPLIEDVVKASERAAGLTSQMLAYAGKGQFITRPVNLSAVVRSMTDFFRATVSKKIELILDLAPELPPIEADTSQLEQVVMNLVINAAEAIPDGGPGTVRVRTSVRDLSPGQSDWPDRDGELRPGPYAALQVSDDGIGMDAETLARIFDPFFTTKFLGRGLGLAAVQGIVRRHQGAFHVESTPGAGTTFTIYFPLSVGRPADAPATDPVECEPARRTILVVDDEEVVRKTASAVLEKLGFHVLCAENGRRGVDIYRQMNDRICMVLLDMTMPVMDGQETLRRLKEIRPDVKVILSSGYNEAEAVRRFAGGGLAGFIQKPYTSTRLAEKVRRLLPEAEATQINFA